MQRPSFDKGYLHPYYEPTWNNPLNKPVSQATVFPRNVAARRLKFPDVPGQPSSPGLTEVRNFCQNMHFSKFRLDFIVIYLSPSVVARPGSERAII